MWKATVLSLLLSGCMVPVFVVERLESLKSHPTTRPWHFEGERVVFDPATDRPKTSCLIH